MIVVDCQQGQPEWHKARCGIPTASQFGKILTPKGKPSRQRDAYMMRLLAEWLMGTQEDEPINYWMQRGYMMQPEAATWYTVQRDTDVQEVGFVYRDEDRLVGCSPDALVGNSGGLEIKCPGGTNHVRTLIHGQVPDEYIPQVQGSLWVTGREWWDFVSYHPDLPGEIIRVEPDAEYQGLLDDALSTFIGEMVESRELLRRRGFEPAQAA